MSFTWLDKFTDAVSAIPDASRRRELEVALVEYGAFGVEPDLEDWALAAIFACAKPDIDYSRKSYESGKRGGRPKKADHEEKGGLETGVPKGGLEEAGETGDENLCRYVGRYVGNTKEEKKEEKANADPEPSKKESCKKFTPPSVEEVADYVSEKGYSVDAEEFVSHYESNGWMVGRNKMKSWHAAVATWERRRRKEDEHGGAELFAEYDR